MRDYYGINAWYYDNVFLAPPADKDDEEPEAEDDDIDEEEDEDEWIEPNF